jgi:hypothetical protein
MGVSCCCLNLRVSKQFSDHRQPFADHKSAGREGVAEIVDAHIIQSGSLANTLPWVLKVCQMGLHLLSHDNVRIVRHAGQRFQQRHCGIAEMDGFRAGLAVG